MKAGTRWCLAALVALMLSATAAFALPIKATIVLTATSGTIGATPLGGVDVTIVAVGDTSANSQFFLGVFGEPATSVTITVPGVGTTTATSPSSLFIYGSPVAFVSAGLGTLSSSEVGLNDPAFSGYQALTSIGPISGVPGPFGPAIGTGLGPLIFTSARLMTFRAEITLPLAAIPTLPPEGLIVLSLLLAVAAVWQLRRKR